MSWFTVKATNLAEDQELEVEYNVNPTKLFKYIDRSQWDDTTGWAAVARCRHPDDDDIHDLLLNEAERELRERT